MRRVGGASIRQEEGDGEREGGRESGGGAAAGNGWREEDTGRGRKEKNREERGG